MFILCRRGPALFLLFTLLCFSACHGRHSDRTNPGHSDPTNSPVAIDQAEAYDHWVSPIAPLRLSKAEWRQLAAARPPCGGNEFLPYELIISESGAVESARLLPYTGSCNFKDNPPDPPALVASHLVEASSLAREQRFIPWVINGHPSRVLIRWDLPIAPPERFGPSRPLPVPIDYDSASVRLERFGCEGRCPVYSITILGDGTVTYEGRGYVKVSGTQRIQISKAAVIQLVQRFREANFGSALPRYIGAYDGRGTLLQLHVNGKSFQVYDGSGLRVGIPTAILNLERDVDETVQSRRWVRGG